jgi:hypothetical protein
MLSPLFIILALINVVVVYALIYYFLYSIKNPINLFTAAFILLVLGSLALITCPLLMSCMGMIEMPEMMKKMMMKM